MERVTLGIEDTNTVEYRIDDLAREAGTTVRNVRAYQERGLLPPTEKRGRVVIYTSVHLARLRMILALLSRGYTLASIGELLDAWQAGQNLGEVLGLEEAITQPWSDEAPERAQVSELLELFNLTPGPTQLATAIELGVIELDEEGVRVPSPKLLQAGAAIVAMGVPFDDVLTEMAALRERTEAIASGFVDLAARHLFEPAIEAGTPLEVGKLAEDIWRLRQIAREVTQIALAKALERQIQERMAAVANRVAPKGRGEEG